MSMYGKYPKVKVDGKWVEQNGLNGAPKAWPTTDCSNDKKLTVQAPRTEVDINVIVKRMQAGKMPEIRQNGKFEDVSKFEGLEDAIIKVQDAKDLFMTLPAEVRSRFSNNPVELVSFLQNTDNRKEAEELGLIEPQSVPDPVQDAHKPPTEAPAQ